MNENGTRKKSQQRFKSDRHNLLTVKINKIALDSNDDKRIQIIDLEETFAYSTSQKKLDNN